MIFAEERTKVTKNKIRLLALDLDGTVLTSANTLDTEVKKAIENAVESGMEIVVASGRPFCSMPEEILKIDGIRYIIASNGAAIYDGGKNRVRSVTLKEADVLKIMELTKEYDLIWEAFCDGETCTDRRYYENPVKYGCGVAYVDYVRSSRGCTDDMRQYIFNRRAVLDSIEFVCNKPKLREKIRALLEENLSGVYITSSSADFVEFMDREATKSNAVRFICEREGIDIKNTAACGNADNDVDMIAQAGLGAAVKNASKSCVDSADLIVETNDNNGVKQLIDNIIEHNFKNNKTL
jgi:Cof subfamily protein (haloacid dehalogenase superfamily)